MPSTVIQTLTPKKGGWGKIFLFAVVMGLVVFVALSVNDIASDYAGQIDEMFGITSAVGLTAADDIISGGVVDVGGQLGKPVYPYSSVLYSMEIYDLRGDRQGTIAQYVWDAEPDNWTDDVTIADDYTEGAPLASSITDGDLDGTLGTTNVFAYDEGGNLLLDLKRYWIHGQITNAKDVFFILDIPNGGAFDTTTPTLQIADFKLATSDETAWTSSAIDLGVDTNSNSNVTHKKLTSYAVEDYNIILIKEIRFNDLNLMGEDGTLEEVTIKLNDCFEWTIYDYSEGTNEGSYSSGGYDYKLQSDNKDSILCTIEAKDYADIEIKFVGKTCGAAAAYCQTYSGNFHNGSTLGVLQIYDLENNLLINQNVQG